MVKNVIIGIICMLLLVTAGSFAYVGYHNTKAHIQTENEKRKAEEPTEEEKPATIREKQKEAEKREKEKKERAEDEKWKKETGVNEDVAHLVSDMYVTPSANGDVSYQYDANETEAGIFLMPYVVEHNGKSATLHLVAGHRGSSVLEFDKIRVEADHGSKELVFPLGTMQQGEQEDMLVSWYDLPAGKEMEDVMRLIAVSVNVKVAIVGHEQENKIMSPTDIQRFYRMLKLYDTLMN